MDIAIVIFLFVIGTVLGSFGSVLLRRLKDGYRRSDIKSILIGRSECPGCHHTLTPSQLLPLWGRIRQKGRCFRCHKSISSLYPVLEIVSGAVMVYRGYIYRGDRSAVSFLIGGVRWLLGILLVRDMYTYELHFPLYLLVVSLVILTTLLQFDMAIFWYALIFWLVFVGIYYFGKRYSKVRFGVYQEAFGRGDVLLAPILGVLLSLVVGGHSGLQMIMLLLYFILIACAVGVVYYIIALIFNRTRHVGSLLHSHRSRLAPMIPFFPAMIISYWIIVGIILIS